MTKTWTKTMCDCGKPAVAHSHDNEQEYAKCADCFIPWHRVRADETRATVRKMLAGQK